MRVAREQFLHTLEMVRPGIAPKGGLLQSDCFCFLNGQVITFNEELACRAASGLEDDLRAAVGWERFLSTIQKMPDDELEITLGEERGDNLLVVKGRGKRRARFRLEGEITLPVEAVEPPGKWRKLHPDFADAITSATSCTGKDEGGHYFWRACVHIAPGWIEACDGKQLVRWSFKTETKESVLVRQEALKHAASLGMTELSVTNGWLHFQSPAGLILSCRRYAEDYPDLGRFIEGSQGGEPLALSKSLEAMASLAGEFSAETGVNAAVRVDLKASGEATVAGVGSSGDYIDGDKIKYSGPAISFLISPKILADVAGKYSECSVNPSSLRIDGADNKYIYVSCLNAPSRKKEEMKDAPAAEVAQPQKRREAVEAKK